MIGTSETAERLQSYAQKEPVVNILVTILSWFVITVEVFLRRDFGERYFTRIKFIMGFVVLFVLNAMSKIGSIMPGSMAGRRPIFDPERGWVDPPPESSFSLGNSAMYIILLLYILISGYHTFRIWWRNGTGRPLHSRDHGLTWLEPIGVLLLAIPNFIIGLFVRLYAFALPKNERAWLSNALPFLRDARTFAERYLEPITILLLGVLFSYLEVSVAARWLNVCSFALFLFTTIRHEMERNQALDYRDKMIEIVDSAEAMGGDTDSLRVPYSTKKAIFDAATMAEKSPGAMDSIRHDNPSLADAMEALNPKLKSMTNKTGKKEAATAPPPKTPSTDAASPAPEAEKPSPEAPKQDGELSVEDAMKNLKMKK